MEAVETVVVEEVVPGTVVVVVGAALGIAVAEVVPEIAEEAAPETVAMAGLETVEEVGPGIAVGLGIEAAAPGIVGLGTVVVGVVVVVDIDLD